MKILVTGGAGFIGSNVVEGYLEAGHRVVVIDDLSSGKRENVHPEAEFYQIDIRSEEVVALMEKVRPDVVNHHAAQISVPASVADPLTDADINLKGLLRLLENAVRCNVKKFIFISSGGAIYGEASEYPTSENYPPRPLSPYAVSKFASEHYLGYYKHQHGLEYTVLRYANIYGPRQIPHGEAGVVAIFMENLFRNQPSVLYHFPEDEEGMTRDYCYVGDVVEANLKALEKGAGDFFNIGTGRGTKTLELYQNIYAAYREIRPDTAEHLAQPSQQQARPGDLRRSCLVVEKARRYLDWRPKTDLPSGLRSTFKWWSQQSV